MQDPLETEAEGACCPSRTEYIISCGTSVNSEGENLEKKPKCGHRRGAVTKEKKEKLGKH